MTIPGKSDGDSDTGSIEVEVTTDRRGAEALGLWLRRLAKAHGLEIASLTVTRAEEDTTSPESGASP